MSGLLLRRLLNPAAFALREALQFRRAGYREGPLDLSRVSPRLRAQLEAPRARALAEAHGLDLLAPRLGHAAYTKSLFVIDLFERLGGQIRIPTGACAVLDVGCKNFECAPGLHAAVARRCGGEVSLTGSEIDAYPVYRNLHSRADAAHYYLGLLPGEHHYLPGDIRAHAGRYGLITWLFPFVTPSPLLWWGLPGRCFAPEEVFRHVLGLLAPGGTLLVANYTPEEVEAQAALFAGAGLQAEQSVIEEPIGRAGQVIYAFTHRA